MKFTLDKSLSLVTISVLTVLGTLPANAALKNEAYKIENITDITDELNPAGYPDIAILKRTQRSYATGVATLTDGSVEMLGVAMGLEKLPEGIKPEFVDGITPEEKFPLSIDKPIRASDFTFFVKENGTDGNWLPEFDALGGSTAPDNTETPNSIESFYYGINAAGTKVGTVSGEPRPPINYEIDGENKTFYIRKFEQRAIAKRPDASQIPLLPSYRSYEYKIEGQDPVIVDLGGLSVAAAINQSNLVAGYASTGISKGGATAIDDCFKEDQTLPIDVCVQAKQYLSAGAIQYQTRAVVWDLNSAQPEPIELPVGFELPSNPEFTYKVQGLGLNEKGDVVGRSYADAKNLGYIAAYWTKKGQMAQSVEYQYHKVPMPNGEYIDSIAYDINDNGLLVGSYKTNFDGYLRTKFFTFDTTDASATIKTPYDFYNYVSDLSSTPRGINNQGLVVGKIDTSHDKHNLRPTSAFLYDSGTVSGTEEFIDLNKSLTCGSKGLVQDDKGNWQPQSVKVIDGTGQVFSYKAEIRLIEASSIAEDGTIAATAFVRKPKYRLDDKGNLLVGENGKPIFELNANGDPLTSFLPRAVVLKSLGSHSKDQICSYVNPVSENVHHERKGAAGLGWLILLPLIWLRRHKKLAK